MMDDLDHLLHKRAEPAPVPGALMARILADAAREQPRRATATAAARPSGLRLGWAVLSDLFGGGGVLAGLATAACAGIYLGAAQPSALSALTLALTDSAAVDSLDFLPSLDLAFVGE